MRMCDWSSDVCSSERAWTHNDSPVKERTDRWRCGCHCRYASPARRQRARCFVGYARKAGADGSGRGCCTTEGGYITACQHSPRWRSEEHTSELQSLMRISYAVFCLKKTNIQEQAT